MIGSVRVRNFQSIEDVKIELGKLTVVQGASSSGKSAFMRAVRMLARNTSSPSVVRNGAKTASVVMKMPEGTVSLERGKGQSLYSLDKGEGEQKYPKSGTSVPDDVAKLLRLPGSEGGDLCFSTQFDRPLLLDESPATAAKVLGELTNAGILHEAVREANRRRLEVNSRLKVRRGDVEANQERLQSYRDLPRQKTVLQFVQSQFSDLQRMETRRSRLLEAVSRHYVSEAALARAQETLREVPDVRADLEALHELDSRRRALASFLEAVWRLGAEYAQAQAEVAQADVEIEQLREQRESLLRELGKCPLCGSNIH